MTEEFDFGENTLSFDKHNTEDYFYKLSLQKTEDPEILSGWNSRRRAFSIFTPKLPSRRITLASFYDESNRGVSDRLDLRRGTCSASMHTQRCASSSISQPKSPKWPVNQIRHREAPLTAIQVLNLDLSSIRRRLVTTSPICNSFNSGLSPFYNLRSVSKKMGKAIRNSLVFEKDEKKQNKKRNIVRNHKLIYLRERGILLGLGSKCSGGGLGLGGVAGKRIRRL